MTKFNVRWRNEITKQRKEKVDLFHKQYSDDESCCSTLAKVVVPKDCSEDIEISGDIQRGGYFGAVLSVGILLQRLILR